MDYILPDNQAARGAMGHTGEDDYATCITSKHWLRPVDLPIPTMTVEPREDGRPDSVTLRFDWSATGVDRPAGYGIVVGRRDVERMRRALESGKLLPNARILTDIAGKTYVEHDVTVYGRHINADLKRLGF